MKSALRFFALFTLCGITLCEIVGEEEEDQGPLEPMIMTGKEMRRYKPFLDRGDFLREFGRGESGFPFPAAVIDLYDGKTQIDRAKLVEFLANLMEDLNPYEEKIDIIEFLYRKVLVNSNDKKNYSISDFCDLIWENNFSNSGQDSIEIDL